VQPCAMTFLNESCESQLSRIRNDHRFIIVETNHSSHKANSVSKPRIKVPRKKIADFCIRNHILKLSLFGSVLHDSFSHESDIDVLVEFDPDHVPGFELIRIQDELRQF
jgi:predicted nucleotidyltransferase